MENKSKNSKNDYQIDAKDREILNLLSKNGMEKLTSLAKKIGLSIDPTKKRMQKLVDSGIITNFTIQTNVSKLGLGYGVHVYLKLKSTSGEEFEKLITYLKNHFRIIDVFSVIGNFDLSLVVLGKDSEEIDSTLKEIRQKFSNVINEWNAVTVSKIHKLEEYKY